MLQLDVVGIRVERPGNNPVVVLREVDGERYLPIWIGATEAAAIAYAQEGVRVARPLTHDLLCSVIAELGHEVEQVRITAIDDGVYYAELVFANGAVVSSRPSDAIAVAVRVGAPIYAVEDVMEAGGIGFPAEEEVVVEQFREFLDNVTPEDFGGAEPGPPE